MGTPRSEQYGYVYFIADEHQRVKVGWTADVVRRLSCMQVCNADRLTLLGALPGTPDDERRILNALGKPIRGEWFARDVALPAMAKSGASIERLENDRRRIGDLAIQLLESPRTGRSRA